MLPLLVCSSSDRWRSFVSQGGAEAETLAACPGDEIQPFVYSSSRCGAYPIMEELVAINIGGAKGGL